MRPFADLLAAGPLAHRVVTVCTLADPAALVAAVCDQLPPPGRVFAVCRNGVYRSVRVAMTLRAAGVATVGPGTREPTSYYRLLAKLQDRATHATREGLAIARIVEPANACALCVDLANDDEVREATPIIEWLVHFAASGLEQFVLVLLDGREDAHGYY